MNRFIIEPISIPKPASPTTGIPLASAEHAGSSGAAPLRGGFGVTSAEAKALARQRDFEVLSEALANSEIRHEDLQVLAHIGHGSAGVVQKASPCNAAWPFRSGRNAPPWHSRCRRPSPLLAVAKTSSGCGFSHHVFAARAHRFCTSLRPRCSLSR